MNHVSKIARSRRDVADCDYSSLAIVRALTDRCYAVIRWPSAWCRMKKRPRHHPQHNLDKLERLSQKVLGMREIIERVCGERIGLLKNA
jgi:hypothetical protein